MKGELLSKSFLDACRSSIVVLNGDIKFAVSFSLLENEIYGNLLATYPSVFLELILVTYHIFSSMP